MRNPLVSLSTVTSWQRSNALLLSLMSLGLLAAADVPTYAKQIQPIFADRCYSCHGPEKHKGDLRLDSPDAITKGGKNGAVLTPGNPSKSTLYTLTLLPTGDDDRMPAKGDTLTQGQTDALRDWIQAGAVFDGVAVAAAPAPAKPEPAGAGAAHLTPSDVDLISAKLSKPDATAIKALTETGAIVTAISTNGNALDIDLSHLLTPLDASALKNLDRLAVNTFWLDLHGTALTDDGLQTVVKCHNLNRLHLDRTAVTDRGVAVLKSLSELAYLNLVSTAIGDAGLVHLASLKKLDHLFLWQSKVTDAGVDKLKAALPALVINRGPTFSTVTVAEPEDGGRKRKKPK
ncbi:MAG TPA: c-type cytochrome domain-containing protein [Planctomycetota bacterium]|nr:c-type cytochrome domain-containing protein [Planctomycetota bacterium]